MENGAHGKQTTVLQRRQNSAKMTKVKKGRLEVPEHVQILLLSLVANSAKGCQKKLTNVTWNIVQV